MNALVHQTQTHNCEANECSADNCPTNDCPYKLFDKEQKNIFKVLLDVLLILGFSGLLLLSLMMIFKLF
ncbi:MAG TPA: hypothetical protein EYQ42_07735 [Thiotrichaceae bacterium]|jgi:hypothetical protein|nr:hypothetical protein [Thiotrichaceae bacterium]HIM08070.1 hypothetical protein [Gammaproteobacteria bacterium]